VFFSLLKDEEIIGEHNTDYLEHFLAKIGRRDIMKKIQKYHASHKEGIFFKQILRGYSLFAVCS